MKDIILGAVAFGIGLGAGHLIGRFIFREPQGRYIEPLPCGTGHYPRMRATDRVWIYTPGRDDQ
jgi:hypothetical protein